MQRRPAGPVQPAGARLPGPARSPVSTPASASRVICSSVRPASASTSRVCCPASGAGRRTDAGVAENRAGGGMTLYHPASGCSASGSASMSSSRPVRCGGRNPGVSAERQPLRGRPGGEHPAERGVAEARLLPQRAAGQPGVADQVVDGPRRAAAPPSAPPGAAVPRSSRPRSQRPAQRGEDALVPAGPRAGREIAPPPCSTSRKASIASAIGTSDPLALPGPLPVEQRGDDRVGEHQPGHLVGEQHRHQPGRPPARRSTSGTPQAAWMMSSNAGASASGCPTETRAPGSRSRPAGSAAMSG